VAVAHRTEDLLEPVKRNFFRFFFRLLLGFVALAEWACVAWALFGLGLEPPAVLHLLAPVGIYLVNRRVILRRQSRPLRDAIVRGYVALAFTCIFCTLFLALAGLGWAVVGPASGLLPAAIRGRVGEIYYWLTNAGFLAVGGLILYGYTVGPRELAITRLRVPVRGLPAPFDGLRIVHVSDLHIGQHLDLAELGEHVRRVNALEPDVVCLTGDLVDRPDTCALAFPTLAGLRARHGVLVTLGNHDFYAGAEAVSAALRQLTSFTLLRDDCAHLRIDGATLTVLGVDDLGRDWARGVLEHPALPRLAAAVPGDRPFIVLSHRPDCFAQAARLGAALMLSGHTHGGQLALPSWVGRRARNLAQFISDFDRGLYRAGDSTLYVNRGLGFTGQKIRLFTPREIACIELAAV
jgi:predicted MPP superfamily phosphohydrolase